MDGKTRDSFKESNLTLPVSEQDAHNADETRDVHRKLKARHLQMIAIGGTIGTGLFIGSGPALSTAGPLGALLGFFIMGIVVYTVMMTLGEMATYLPTSGGFTEYAARFVDPALGFAMGWNYWYSYAVTLPAELVAAAIVVSYWDTNTNPGIYIAVFYVVIVAINFGGVKYYGEFEFWFSLIKVTTIVALIIMGVILDAGGGPDHDKKGFRYWSNPGAINQMTAHNPDGSTFVIDGALGRFLAFWAVMLRASFSYIGTEIVAVAAGEAQNPRKNVPRAIENVFFRILFFYVGGIFIVGLLVPYNDDLLLSNSDSGTASASPFVIGIKRAGITVVPDIINAVILVSAFSAGNSDVYASSRTMYALGRQKLGPRFLTRVSKDGLPYVAVALSAILGALAFIRISSDGTSEDVFNWFVNLSTISGLFTWATICVAYIRFYAAMKAQGIDRDTLPYKSPFQPYTAWFGLIMCSIIIIFNGFEVFLGSNFAISDFLTAYIGIPIFFLLYAAYKVICKTSTIPAHEIDLISGKRELDAMDWEEDDKDQPRTFLQKIFAFLL